VKLYSSRSRAFTLVEIMIVVSIVGILSALSVFVIGRVKDRAARSMLQNNLRQIYQAKEHYFSESGASDRIKVMVLIQNNYLRRSLVRALYHHESLETRMGWVYPVEVGIGEPVSAKQYVRGTSGAYRDIVWYPEPPADAAPANARAP
jgi:prepilin-type N-terminal cleavage/methylation domain-containing protein